MKLGELIVNDAIVPALNNEQRDEVIQELVDALVNADALDASLRDEVIEHIIAREKSGSTGFGKGVAVPHARHAKLEKMVAAVGVSAKGVDFNALDKAPVYSVFLLLSPMDHQDEHLQAMESIFRNLQNDTFRRFLRQAQTRDDVIELIGEADANQL